MSQTIPENDANINNDQTINNQNPKKVPWRGILKTILFWGLAIIICLRALSMHSEDSHDPLARHILPLSLSLYDALATSFPPIDHIPPNQKSIDDILYNTIFYLPLYYSPLQRQIKDANHAICSYLLHVDNTKDAFTNEVKKILFSSLWSDRLWWIYNIRTGRLCQVVDALNGTIHELRDIVSGFEKTVGPITELSRDVKEFVGNMSIIKDYLTLSDPNDKNEQILLENQFQFCLSNLQTLRESIDAAHAQGIEIGVSLDNSLDFIGYVCGYLRLTIERLEGIYEELGREGFLVEYREERLVILREDVCLGVVGFSEEELEVLKEAGKDASERLEGLYGIIRVGAAIIAGSGFIAVKPTRCDG